MSNLQKEGVIISAVSLILMLVSIVSSDWGEKGWNSSAPEVSFMQADVGPKWPAIDILDEESGLETKHYLLHFRLKNAFSFLLVILVYGVLRSFAIIRRLFKFEAAISRLIPQSKE